MVWVILVIAGLFEIGWAIGLKYTEGFTRLWPTIGTILSMAISVWLLGVATKSLSVGTAYSIWVGIGAVGTVALGALLFEEPINSARLISVALIIAGIIGLKLTTANLQHKPECTGLRDRLINRSEALKIVVPAASVAAVGSLVFATAVRFNSTGLLKPYGYILLGAWTLVPPLWFLHEWVISVSLPTVEQYRIKHFHDLIRNIWLAFVLILGAIMGVENPLK